MNSHFWEKLGECIIDVVLSQEAVRDLPGAAQAWVIFTACLVDQMRAGFDLNKQQPQQLTKQNTVNFHAAHLLDPNEQHPNNSLGRIDETGGERKASIGPRESMEEEDDHIEV
ncbi:hypothetical protein WR25_15009 [Diploscapter pachys]|uniref:Globin family profile domain-containing protein n=1 Tax=Diploscapter pachys TaxID=2018661 RepID=A0A2A2K8Y2_9BILA|nr:hypothetical protein WR25_15009 [Diploscapter pachys]